MPRQRNKGLTEAEWKIMDAVWSLSSKNERCSEWGVLTREVYDYLLKRQKAHISTVSTQMAVLVKKGFLAKEQHGHLNFHRPLVSRQEMLRFELTLTIKKAFDGDVNKALASISEAEKLGQFSPQQAADARALLKELSA